MLIEVAPTPSISINPANSSVQLSGNFTLVMADAGPVGTDETQGQTRHWLVNSVTLNGLWKHIQLCGNFQREFIGIQVPTR